MLDNIIFGNYYPIKSKIHSMNPISKIMCLIIFILMIFLCNDIKIMFLIFILSVLLCEMAHIPRKVYYKTLKSLKILIVFIVIFYLLSGLTYIDIIISIMRLVGIVLYSTIITLTTPPNEITYGIQKVMFPLKLIGIPVNKMALSISLAIRFIPSIIDQSSKILKSQASRGVDYENSNIKGKFTAVKAMLIPMFILTIRKADILAESMQIRLYNINSKRTNYRLNKWSLFDSFLFLLHLIILIFLIVRMAI